MKFKRRIKIVSRTERKFSISLKRQPVSFFCDACDAATEMFSINEAAKHLKTAWREIVRLVESGELHSAETDAGEIYVCAASLGDENKLKQKGEK